MTVYLKQIDKMVIISLMCVYFIPEKVAAIAVGGGALVTLVIACGCMFYRKHSHNGMLYSLYSILFNLLTWPNKHYKVSMIRSFS